VLAFGRACFLAAAATIPVLAVRLPGQVAVSDFFLLLATGAALARRALAPERLPTAVSWAVPGFLVATGSALATFQAVSAGGSLAIAARVLFILLVWPWTARTLLRDRADQQRAVLAFVVGAAASGAVAMGQATLSIFPDGGLYGRATGLAQHPNDAGGSLALGLVLSARAHTFGGRGTVRRHAVLFVLIGAGLVLSGSVTGMLSAIGGLGLMVVRRGLDARRVLLAGVALFVALLVATSIQASIATDGIGRLTPLERFDQATGGGTSAQNTLASRLDTDREAIDRILEQPFLGHGLDPESGIVMDDLAVHNWLLLAWFQGGVLFVAGNAMAVSKAVRGLVARRSRDPFVETLLLGVATAVAFALTGPVLFNRYFWFPAVLLVVVRSTRAPSRPVGAVGEPGRAASGVRPATRQVDVGARPRTSAGS